MKPLFVIFLSLASFVIAGCTDQVAGLPESKPESVMSERSKKADIKNDDPTFINVLKHSVSASSLKADEISKPMVKNEDVTQYKLIEWTDLMPKGDLEALLNPPKYITEAEEGSLEDQISNGLKGAMASEIDDPYQRALVSKSVVLEFDGQAIKLAGFVVPLEFSDDNVITEFFLVPFFGACIHVPAPPPNQIIFVTHEKGFKLDALYNPIWVSGVLSASLIENDVATSAYTLNMASHEPYKIAPNY